MATKTNLYKKAVKVTEEYLGPAGERFIRRQISTHLNIEPELLDKKSMPKLVNWSSIAFALLTNNQADLDAFKKDMQAISANGK